MISILKKPNVLLPPLVATLWVLLTSSPTASAFYDPSLQRWINRDPLEEEDGPNLYRFAGNEPMSSYDALGLQKAPPAPPTQPKQKPQPRKRPKCPYPDCQWPSSAGGIEKIPEEGSVDKAGEVAKQIALAIAKQQCYRGCEDLFGVTSPDEDRKKLKECKDDCDKDFVACGGKVEKPGKGGKGGK